MRDQLPQNALAIKILSAKAGQIELTEDGGFYDNLTGDKLVQVNLDGTGMSITREGAGVIFQNILKFELSHKEFAIVKEMFKPRPTRVSTAGRLTGEDAKALLEACLNEPTEA